MTSALLVISINKVKFGRVLVCGAHGHQLIVTAIAAHRSLQSVDLQIRCSLSSCPIAPTGLLGISLLSSTLSTNLSNNNSTCHARFFSIVNCGCESEPW